MNNVFNLMDDLGEDKENRRRFYTININNENSTKTNERDERYV